ncbi:hypothetical protein M0812_23489 [Anaeramoeba flamelloides]|uniref:PAS domain-containing protein n=1 Tax=Anaeramoeba flamelloides TaxID=1746091 RepID=A0AAV7YPA7_9EUKA|nr:hypothetical protein M0812_23489 [Anaeramoeba flamelloides]
MGTKQSSENVLEKIPKRNEKAFFTLLENMDVSIAVWDENFKMYYFNPVFRRMCNMENLKPLLGNSTIKNNTPGGKGILVPYQPFYRKTIKEFINSIISELLINTTTQAISLLRDQKNEKHIFEGMTYFKRIKIGKQTFTTISILPIRETPLIDPMSLKKKKTKKNKKTKKIKRTIKIKKTIEIKNTLEIKKTIEIKNTKKKFQPQILVNFSPGRFDGSDEFFFEISSENENEKNNRDPKTNSKRYHHDHTESNQTALKNSHSEILLQNQNTTKDNSHVSNYKFIITSSPEFERHENYLEEILPTSKKIDKIFEEYENRILNTKENVD